VVTAELGFSILKQSSLPSICRSSRMRGTGDLKSKPP
jgi:hypothetical protein